MPNISSSTSKLHSMLVPRPPRIALLPIQSILQPAAFPTPRNVKSRLNSSLSKEWTGTSSKDNAVDRAKRRDTTDPVTDAAAATMKDREESGGIANSTKPQGATEREGSKSARKAKEEHPKAPEPIIGMNDERARKGD